ncbi:MAG TPA: ABC-2 family transporter protein [Kineosporiaceae bacterium]|jgi:ABC-2 type transport system permease protein|nr:ABC-2 family transporter protein [Kineosporiaceae bacterium]
MPEVPPALRPYAALAAAGFSRYTSYRAALAAGALTNAVFGLLRASILVATLAARGGAIGGYDRGTAVTYAWITQALIAVVELFTWNELALRVRTGDIAVDLCRPVDPLLAWGAADVGRAAAVVLPRGLPVLLVGTVTTGLTLSGVVLPYLLGAVSVLLAVLLSFACRCAVNLVAFWTVEVRGVLGLYVVLSTTLSGLVLPVSWFPPWLARIAAATPFPAMVQLPTDILLGRATGWHAAAALAVQAGWLLAVGVLARLLLVTGRRRLVVQGG